MIQNITQSDIYIYSNRFFLTVCANGFYNRGVGSLINLRQKFSYFSEEVLPAKAWGRSRQFPTTLCYNKYILYEIRNSCPIFSLPHHHLYISIYLFANVISSCHDLNEKETHLKKSNN